VIALTPPAVVDAMRDPEITGTTRTLYDWCLLHLDPCRFRPIKRSALPKRVAEKLPVLVALGYLDRVTRPNGGGNEYRLYWSRAEKAA
jgi:hypothetical protein